MFVVFHDGGGCFLVPSVLGLPSGEAGLPVEGGA